MTPLAHAIVADSTLPVKKRLHGHTAESLRLLDGVHFFEVTQVYAAARDMALSMVKNGTPSGKLAFLPAPRTFLEFREPEGRCGILLEETKLYEGRVARVTGVAHAQGRGPRIEIAQPSGFLFLRDKAYFGGLSLDLRKYEACKDSIALRFQLERYMDAILYALLAMINTPRVIGRRQHMPHAGLQRKLAAAHHMPGKYPLQAWHELVLEVAPPRIETGEPKETRLTGERALHFVRAHLRICNGRLEPTIVAAHWRGNPDLGIKQTRYRVVPPRNAA